MTLTVGRIVQLDGPPRSLPPARKKPVTVERLAKAICLVSHGQEQGICDQSIRTARKLLAALETIA
jgi:hypothetical protein